MEHRSDGYDLKTSLSSTSPSESSSSSDDVPKIHSLVLVQHDQYLGIRKKNRLCRVTTTLDLSQGENWLQLPQRVLNDAPDVDDGSDTDSDAIDDIPRILSSTTSVSNNNNATQAQEFWLLSATEPSVLDENLVGCFLCLDVDETYLTIKDMRTPQQHSEAEDGSEWVVAIGRSSRKKRRMNNRKDATLKDPHDLTSSCKNENNTKRETQCNDEELPRRQLRILYHNDVIILKRQKSYFENDAVETKILQKLILQYQYDVTIDRHKKESKRHAAGSEILDFNNHDESGRKTSSPDTRETQEEDCIVMEIEQPDNSHSISLLPQGDEKGETILASSAGTEAVSANQEIVKSYPMKDDVMHMNKSSKLPVTGQLVVDKKSDAKSGESIESESDYPTPHSTACSSAVMSSMDDDMIKVVPGRLFTQPMSIQGSPVGDAKHNQPFNRQKLKGTEESEACINRDMKVDDEYVVDDDSTIDPDDETLENFVKRVSNLPKQTPASDFVMSPSDGTPGHVDAHEEEMPSHPSQPDSSDLGPNGRLTLLNNHIDASNELNDDKKTRTPSDLLSNVAKQDTQIREETIMVVSRRDKCDAEESENMLALKTPPSGKAKSCNTVAENVSVLGSGVAPDGDNDQIDVFSESLLSQGAQQKATVAFADMAGEQKLEQHVYIAASTEKLDNAFEEAKLEQRVDLKDSTEMLGDSLEEQKLDKHVDGQDCTAISDNTVKVSNSESANNRTTNNRLQTDIDVAEVESKDENDTVKVANLNNSEQMSLESEGSYFQLITQPYLTQFEQDVESSNLNVRPRKSLQEMKAITKMAKDDNVMASTYAERDNIKIMNRMSPVSEAITSSIHETLRDDEDNKDQANARNNSSRDNKLVDASDCIATPKEPSDPISTETKLIEPISEIAVENDVSRIETINVSIGSGSVTTTLAEPLPASIIEESNPQTIAIDEAITLGVDNHESNSGVDHTATVTVADVVKRDIRIETTEPIPSPSLSRIDDNSKFNPDDKLARESKPATSECKDLNLASQQPNDCKISDENSLEVPNKDSAVIECDLPAADGRSPIDATLQPTVEKNAYIEERILKEELNKDSTIILPHADSISHIDEAMQPLIDMNGCAEIHLLRPVDDILVATDVTPKQPKPLTQKAKKRKVSASADESDVVESIAVSASVLKRSKRNSKPVDDSIPNRKTLLPHAVSNNSSNVKKRSVANRDIENSPEAVGSNDSARKRSRPTSETADIIQNIPMDDYNSDEVRVVVTGLELTQAQKKMLKRINGTLLENIEQAHTATHAIVTDGTVSIRRTPKLMIALCRTPNIITSDWLLQSSKAGKPLKTEKFLVLDDKAEKQYDFSLRKTINTIKTNVKHGKYLLAGYYIYVCNGVAGNKSPPKQEFRLIVEAAGGKWLTSLSSKDHSDTLLPNTIIITSDPETKKQISAKDVVAALKAGAYKKTSSWLFHATMTQELIL